MCTGGGWVEGGGPVSSEDIDLPTAAGSSSTLSESQYTHVHCDSGYDRYNVSLVLYRRWLLKSVVATLKKLGLELGLLYPTLQIGKAQRAM